jgi:hypothetical protein
MVTLPPDLDGLNGDRAGWARAALEAFAAQTGVDWEDALGDLLADLMHLSDRVPFDFQAALERGRDHYAAETGSAPYDGAAFFRIATPTRSTKSPNITIQIHRGLITDVSGLPSGYELHVEDYDMDDEQHPQWNAEKECIVTVYEGASV